METLIDLEIKLVNNMIFNAIKHGADCGGSYESNEEGLLKSINGYLVMKGIDGIYEVKKQNIDGWRVHQIVEK